MSKDFFFDCSDKKLLFSLTYTVMGTLFFYLLCATYEGKSFKEAVLFNLSLVYVAF